MFPELIIVMLAENLRVYDVDSDLATEIRLISCWNDVSEQN